MGGGGSGSGGNVFGMVIRGPNYPTPESGNSSWGAALVRQRTILKSPHPTPSPTLPFPTHRRFRPATGNPFRFGKKKGVGPRGAGELMTDNSFSAGKLKIFPRRKSDATCRPPG